MTSPCTHLLTELTPAQQGNVSFLGHSGNEVVSLCLTPTYKEKKSPDGVHKSSGAGSFASSPGSSLINHLSRYRKLGLLKINIIFMPTFSLGYLSKIYLILSSLLKLRDSAWKP